MRQPLFASLALVFVLPLLACGHDSHNTTIDGGITCRTDPRSTVYSPNQSKTGKSGNFNFTLVSSEPGPPAKGNNTWTVKVTTAAGQPVSGAALEVTPFMPDHGHGTSIVPQVTAAGDTFTATPLYLFMPGLWRVTLKATVGAAPAPTTVDTADWFFCIEG